MLVIGVSSLVCFLVFLTPRGCLPKTNDSLADRAFQPLSAPLKMRDDGGAHAWIPEFLQMVGDGGDRVTFTLRREEPADLVGHHHQSVGRHARYSAATLAIRRLRLACSAYSLCQSLGPLDGATWTAVTLYSGQFVAQSENSVVTTL